METVNPHLDSKVRARLRARARRVSILRRRVAAVALSAFVMAWGVIYATGSMGAETSTTASSAQRLAATQTSSGTNSDDSGSSSSASSPTTVTTSQS